MRMGPLQNGIVEANISRRRERKVQALRARSQLKIGPPKPPIVSIHTYHAQGGECLHYPCEYHPDRKPPNELREFTVTLMKTFLLLIVLFLFAWWFGGAP